MAAQALAATGLGSRGALIVFEGADRCGKSTQTRLLVDALAGRGADATLQRFPDRQTAIGSMIDRYLKCEAELDDRAVHLLFAANRWECSGALAARVRAGGVVVCDRYAYSGVAFSGAKPGLGLAWCKRPDVGLPEPDAVIYLDLPTEDAERRGDFGAERYERGDMQRRVADNFRQLIDGDARARPGLWHVLDARRSIEDLHEEIVKIGASRRAARARGARRGFFCRAESHTLRRCVRARTQSTRPSSARRTNPSGGCGRTTRTAHRTSEPSA